MNETACGVAALHLGGCYFSGDGFSFFSVSPQDEPANANAESIRSHLPEKSLDFITI